MQIPLQVAFQGCEPSDPVRTSIEREFERLEAHNRRITSGRVTVIAPSDMVASMIDRLGSGELGKLVETNRKRRHQGH